MKYRTGIWWLDARENLRRQEKGMDRCLDIKPYNGINYKLCYHAPLFSALNYWGVDLAVFFSNDIFTYSFHKEDDHLLKCDNIEIVSEDIILNRVGLVQYELGKFEEDEIIKAIQHGYPVFVPIDRYYWKDLKYNAAMYQRSHRTHYFLVVGYEKRPRMFVVIDIFDDGEKFKAFYNKIDFEMLRQCSHMYNLMKQDKWKLAVLDIVKTDCGRLKQDYKAIFRTNLESYKSNIFNSFENIIYAIHFLKENISNTTAISKVAEKSINMYAGMNYKKVQAYEITYFWEEASCISDICMHLAVLHFKMISIFRKMHIGRKFDEKYCSKEIEIMKQIYEKEVQVYNMIFSLI